ncbi:hypothetical protein [Sulfurimonas sp.]|uniref:hypothetical protein n=1 Tax=Sulfurimonas sp. TaxID=2022749 RepID=UPI003D134223
MKFLVVKNLKHDQHFKPILTGLLLFILFYIPSDFYVKAHSLGVTQNTLQSTLFGNDEEYLDPMQTSVFLENWHVEIFFMMMILLTLSAVFIRLSNHIKFDSYITHLTMICAFSSLLSLAGCFFLYPKLSFIYLGTFYLWHIGALYMVVTSLKRLYVN